MDKSISSSSMSVVDIAVSIVTFLIFLGAALAIAYGLWRMIQDKNSRDRDLAASQQTALMPVWLGFITVFIFSVARATQAQTGILAVLGTSLAVAGASLVAGSLLGFLFGVPRAARTEPRNLGQRGNSLDVDPLGGQNWGRDRFADNTNIEEISDWLTKILVGIGLVQLKFIPNYLGQLGEQLKNSAIGSSVFGIALVIHFSICGFYIGYLSSRLFLPGALTRALRERMEQLEQKLQEVDKRQEQDKPPDQ